jgi:cytochrome c-type biogenesis protein CcmH
MMRVLTILALAVLIPATAIAVDREQEARELEAMLIAPCCFVQQVSVHQSEAAVEIRRDIRQRLASGQTRDEILDAYVGQYGKRILAQPPAAGFDRLLYLVPPFALVLSAGLTVALVRRFALRRSFGPHKDEPQGAAGTGATDDTYAEALEDELRNLD